LRWDAASDKYVPVEGATAFEEICALFGLKAPCSTRRAARRSRRRSCTDCLPEPMATTICPTVRTCATRPPRWRCPKASECPSEPATLDDFKHTDCIFFFGQNVGTSSPRTLHQLQEAAKRGVPIVAFNPPRERGLTEFVNPQSPAEMLIKPAYPHHIAISPTQGRRRPRRHYGHRQGPFRS
jgi:hypothetical protein